MDIIILGLPRSGTSLVAKMLQNSGYDLTGPSETVDKYYPKELNKDGFFQRLDVHLLTIKYRLQNFDTFIGRDEYAIHHLKNIVDSFGKTTKKALKDPYLLFMMAPYMEMIKRNGYKKPIIVTIRRNIDDVIRSCNKFARRLEDNTDFEFLREIGPFYYNCADELCERYDIPIIRLEYEKLIK